MGHYGFFVLKFARVKHSFEVCALKFAEITSPGVPGCVHEKSVMKKCVDKVNKVVM